MEQVVFGSRRGFGILVENVVLGDFEAFTIVVGIVEMMMMIGIKGIFAI